MVGWLDSFQIVGIVGGLFFTGAAFTRDAKAREIENLLTLAQMHRDLWDGKCQRKELDRIFQNDAEVSSEPPKQAEIEFLNLVFIHFQVGWSVSKAGALITTEELRDDLREFFKPRLRRAIWDNTKAGRNRKFVKFVDHTIRRG